METVITLSAKQKRGKIANVILTHWVQPRLLPFQQNWWTAWSRLGDFITQDSQTTEESVRVQQMCYVKIPFHTGRCQRESGKQTIWAGATCRGRNWPQNVQISAEICQTWCPHGCETEREKPSNPLSYRNSSFLGISQAWSHLKLSPSCPISTDKNPRLVGAVLPNVRSLQVLNSLKPETAAVQRLCAWWRASAS